MRRARFTAAFTLVELLVVIGIIAALIAILMPSLAAARQQALMMRCGANLADIGRAMQMYATEHRGRIPRGYDYDMAYRGGRILWAEALSRYLGHPIDVRDISASRDAKLAVEFRQMRIYQCPTFPNPQSALDYVSNSWDVGGDDGAAINVTKLRRASELIFLTEANARALPDVFRFHDVWEPSHLPTVNGKQLQPSARIANDKRHRGQVNILYLDGHVASKPFVQIVRRDFDMRVP